jgi:hypothetical protein
MICGKIIFQSKSDAKDHIDGLNLHKKRPGQSKNRLNTIYFCNDCNGWHLASKSFKRSDKYKSDTVNSSILPTKSIFDSNKILKIKNFTSKK